MSSKRINGLDDFSRKLLEEILNPFMPIESRIRSKTLALTNETINAINACDTAVSKSLKENIPLPKET